jgi:FtsP/CotA-like multicopper oxidase with cupredoxin domain
VSLEIAPGQIVKTIRYNGPVPGPLLRMKGGRPDNRRSNNDTVISELVHWHGLTIPAEVDGAEEEGASQFLRTVLRAIVLYPDLRARAVSHT